jgi:hypothetical protein
MPPASTMKESSGAFLVREALFDLAILSDAAIAVIPRLGDQRGACRSFSAQS